MTGMLDAARVTAELELLYCPCVWARNAAGRTYESSRQSGERLRHENRSTDRYPSSKYAMSHGSLGKQSCLAWIIASETWAESARGLAHHRASLSRGPSSSPSAANTWVNPRPTIPSTTLNCRCGCARDGRYLAVNTFSPRCCKSWLGHLEQDPAPPLCSHGHVLFSLTAQCKQLKKKERKASLWVTKSTVELSPFLWLSQVPNSESKVVFSTWRHAGTHMITVCDTVYIMFVCFHLFFFFCLFCFCQSFRLSIRTQTRTCHPGRCTRFAYPGFLFKQDL